MKPYACNYSWQDVKDATNRCLLAFYQKCPNKDQDVVKDVFNDGLPQAMDKVAIRVFQDNDHECDIADIDLIREAYTQINAVGYIGKKE